MSIMPKIIRRKQTIKHFSKVCYQRLLEHFQQDDDSSDEDSSLEDDLDMAFMSCLEHVRSRCYLSRGSCRKSKGRKEIIAEDCKRTMHNSDGERPWQTAEDFKWKYRVDRESFWLIHDLIKDHDVFKQKGPRGRPQTDVTTQLCIFLRFRRQWHQQSWTVKLFPCFIWLCCLVSKACSKGNLLTRATVHYLA
jgi:hypothetical protein